MLFRSNRPLSNVAMSFYNIIDPLMKDSSPNLLLLNTQVHACLLDTRTPL